jgi:adenylate cyclase
VAGVADTRRASQSSDGWGDTVNIASRMESHGNRGFVHVSKETYELVKNQVTFDEPRSIEVKGKGLMETYLLKPMQ